MRDAMIIPALLLLAACDDTGSAWENEQSELANEANGIEPAPPPANVIADTDYLNNTVEPPANEAAPPQ